MSVQSKLIFFLVSFLVIFIWSAVHPHDFFTWFLEVLPAVVGVAILAATYRRFKFTDLAYVLVFLHAIILMIGGHYTYAEVPLFNWIKDTFGLSRNHYDRVGHFAQGFVPAILAREILLRTTALKRGKMLSYLVVSICLALSAFYELIEWRVSVAAGAAADAFLGIQGDIWDTQWDMTFALVGAVSSLLLLGRLHDRMLERIPGASRL